MYIKITVTKEDSKGRNIQFHNKSTGASMSRAQFANEIDAGKHKDYHVRLINGLRTPVSNPDPQKNNNLN